MFCSNRNSLGEVGKWVKVTLIMCFVEPLLSLLYHKCVLSCQRTYCMWHGGTSAGDTLKSNAGAVQRDRWQHWFHRHRCVASAEAFPIETCLFCCCPLFSCHSCCSASMWFWCISLGFTIACVFSYQQCKNKCVEICIAMLVVWKCVLLCE